MLFFSYIMERAISKYGYVVKNYTQCGEHLMAIFDNILINHYRLNKELLADIENHINDDGVLFICGFGDKHKVDSKIRKEDLIQPSDFKDINKSFDLIKYIENEDDTGFIVADIFREMKS